MFARFAFLALALAFAASPTAFAAESAPPDPVVARVDGVTLHRSDVEAARHRLPVRAQKLPFAAVYPVLVNRLVDATLVAEAGRKERLDRDPALQRQVRGYENALIEDAYLKRVIAAEETDARLKARYAAYAKERAGQEEVHARHILVKTKAEAEKIIAELNKGADFATLAKKHSTGPSGASGGDLGYFTQKEMVPAFAKAAFALPVGGYTKQPVHTRFGWHVIKVEDRRKRKVPSFKEAKAEIRHLVARDIVAAKVKALRAAANVEIFGPNGKPLPAHEAHPTK